MVQVGWNKGRREERTATRCGGDVVPIPVVPGHHVCSEVPRIIGAPRAPMTLQRNGECTDTGLVGRFEADASAQFFARHLS
jgi:hypothetical protein